MIKPGQYVNDAIGAFEVKEDGRVFLHDETTLGRFRAINDELGAIRDMEEVFLHTLLERRRRVVTASRELWAAVLSTIEEGNPKEGTAHTINMYTGEIVLKTEKPDV